MVTIGDIPVIVRCYGGNCLCGGNGFGVSVILFGSIFWLHRKKGRGVLDSSSGIVLRGVSVLSVLVVQISTI